VSIDRVGRRDPRDVASIDAFVASASPGLFRSAVLLTGDRSEAEDLLQDALLRTLRRWDAITGPPAAYTFTVLVNLSRDRHRSRRRRPRTAPDHELPDRAAVDPIGGFIERQAITSAAWQLPAVQREVLACRFVMDMTVAETARALSLPEGTVKSYTARALARMRELLGGEAIASARRRVGGTHDH
jgi:RNA polymerase sigma-70 factor (sigma-E family)